MRLLSKTAQTEGRVTELKTDIESEKVGFDIEVERLTKMKQVLGQSPQNRRCPPLKDQVLPFFYPSQAFL